MGRQMQPMKMTGHLKIQIIPQSQHAGLPHHRTNRRSGHRTTISVNRCLHARQVLVHRLLRPQLIVGRLKLLIPVDLRSLSTATIAILRSHPVIHRSHTIRILTYSLRTKHRRNRALLSKWAIAENIHPLLLTGFLATGQRIATFALALVRLAPAVGRHCTCRNCCHRSRSTLQK